MPVFMKLDWGNWLYGLVAGFIGGGAGAVVTGVTASMLVPDRLAIGSSKFFVLIGVVFLAHGCISTMMYLQQHPLPNRITLVEESKSRVVEPDKTTVTATKTTTTVMEDKKP